MAALSSTTATRSKRLRNGDDESLASERKVRQTTRAPEMVMPTAPLTMIPLRLTDAVYLPSAYYEEPLGRAKDVPELDSKLPVRFAPDTRRGSRCRPTTDVSVADAFTTLSECKSATTRGAMMLAEIQRLAGEYVGIEDLVSDEYKENSAALLPIVLQDLEESKDVLGYYSQGDDGPKIALSLLQAGYGTKFLHDLLVMLIQKDFESLQPADYQIYNLVVNNPSWLQGISDGREEYSIKAALWLWGIRHLMSLLDEGRIDLEQFKEQAQLLVNNVYPISGNDAIHLMDIEDGLKSTVPPDIVDYLLRAVIDKFVLLSAYDAQEVIQGIVRSYSFYVCSSINQDRRLDSRLLDLIDQASELSSAPQLKRLLLERQLQKLINQLKSLPAYPEDEKDQKLQVLLEAQVDSLIAQGVGRCMWPESDGWRVDLQKKILRPVVREYTRSIDATNRFDTNLLAANQIQLLLQESTLEDVRELVLLLTTIDPSSIFGEKLIGEIEHLCIGIDSLGCAVSSPIIDRIMLMWRAQQDV